MSWGVFVAIPWQTLIGNLPVASTHGLGGQWGKTHFALCVPGYTGSKLHWQQLGKTQIFWAGVFLATSMLILGMRSRVQRTGHEAFFRAGFVSSLTSSGTPGML
eukprot:1298884-Pyramimonas_sp.AAC.1